MIRAAGAVLWRQKSHNEIEIAIIHRPRYDDWSLPKGKIEDGESALECAYRELFEETGIRANFTRQLDSIEYEDNGQSKRVIYWAAQSLNPLIEFVANEEVDQLQWLSPTDALEALTHPLDAQVLGNFIKQPANTDTLIILRHTKALDRGDWDTDDSQRPLSDLGWAQAQKLITRMAPYVIDEIYTSDYLRCLQTVAPLADARRIVPVAVPNLNEATFEIDPQRSITFANALKQDQKNILVCSHNPIIPTMLRGILNTTLKNRDLIKLEPGDAWIIHRVNGEIIGLDFYSISN
jgi:8-oxo-(d)GTP phosphatase